MKIKRKVEMNLPQLIEWVWKSEKSDVKAKFFKCKEGNEIKHIIFANPTGRLNLDSERYYDKNELFTVEVEEEIMEDTEFKELICLDVDDRYNSYDNVCVLDFKKDRVRAIYIPNDDLTLTLIWTHEKGLVE